MGVHNNFAGLKFFRADHRHDEIHAKRKGNDSENDIFHKIFRLKFFAADRVKRERGEKHDGRSEVYGIKHNFSNTRRGRDERDNATFLLWGELEAADFADQMIALPIACEISCRAWP
jgi:hypothetical protein